MRRCGVPGKVEKWVWGFDAHYDKLHQPTFEVMLEFMDDYKPYGFVFGGDQFDNAELSHHN
jgi:hypothetical protein